MKTDQINFNELVKNNSLNESSKQKNDQSFKKAFNDALHRVNNLQKKSDSMTEKLALGKVDNIHQVMIASEKAKLSLDLTLEIRNKVVNAYNKIMRMQV